VYPHFRVARLGLGVPQPTAPQFEAVIVLATVPIERGLATVAMAAAQPEHAVSRPESAVAE
jgi:hypothetical protein